MDVFQFMQIAGFALAFFHGWIQIRQKEITAQMIAEAVII